MLALVTTLIGAPVGIGIVATDDWIVASGVADALERSIDRSLPRGAVRLPNDESCQARGPVCAERARRERELSEVLFLRVFTGVTKHLVIAERFPLEGEPGKVTVSLPTSGRGWEVELSTIVRELLEPDPERHPGSDPPPVEATTVGLWGPALIITSAVIVGTATILSQQAAGARMDLLARDETPAEFDRLTEKRDDYRISSFVMFGLGGLFAGAGVVLVLFDL